jgi:hypothetical protein
MPIAAAGSEEAQVESDVRKLRADVGIVAGVAGFHRVQALGFEPLDHGAGAAFLQMRDRDHSTSLMHHSSHGGKRGQGLVYEGRSPTPQKTIEGIIEARGSAVANDGTSHMGSTHRATAGFLEYALERKIDAKSPQLFHHLTCPSQPVVAAALEKLLQGGRVDRQQVPEHVHFTPWSCGGELTTRYHPHPTALAGRHGLGNACEGIVIRQGHRAEPGSPSSSHNAFRRDASVRSGRVHMQVDRFRAVRDWSRAQRRYPSSGAVQDGCECRSNSRNSWSLS